mgnify:CR=1 FL=1
MKLNVDCETIVRTVGVTLTAGSTAVPVLDRGRVNRRKP